MAWWIWVLIANFLIGSAITYWVYRDVCWSQFKPITLFLIPFWLPIFLVGFFILLIEG